MPRKRKRRYDDEHPFPCGCKECTDRNHMLWFGTVPGQLPKPDCLYYSKMIDIVDLEKKEKTRLEKEAMEQSKIQEGLPSQQPEEAQESGFASAQAGNPKEQIRRVANGEGEDIGLGQEQITDEDYPTEPTADWENTEILETNDGE